MSDGMPYFFWDSCVFSALLYDENSSYDLPSIEKYLSEAKNGKIRIVTSSVVFAEIAQSKIKNKKIGSINDLINDMVGAVVVVDASVNIFRLAGQLKDIPYKKGVSEKRFLSTGDAIMLSTALYIEEAFEVKIDCFYTFDNAQRKQVPLLDYHLWCEGLRGPKAQLAQRVCSLKRAKPIHPTPELALDS